MDGKAQYNTARVGSLLFVLPFPDVAVGSRSFLLKLPWKLLSCEIRSKVSASRRQIEAMKPPQPHLLPSPSFYTISAASLVTIVLTLILPAAQSSPTATERRILHQPLYPQTDPSPPSDTTPAYPNPDIPFYPEVPISDHTPPPPLNDAASSAGAIPIPAATQPTMPAKKLAVAISVGIVSLGMLSALAFFLLRHRARQSSDTQKLVACRSEQSRPLPPPSNFLYIGTVEPSSRRFASAEGEENAAANHSPYHKLPSDKKFSSRYRPSPELQPLPPLVRPLGNRNSRSAMSVSSEDEESLETSFYTPNGSASDAPVYSSSSNIRSLLKPSKNEESNRCQAPTLVVPHSRRTSPKSRLHPAPPPPAILPYVKPLSSLTLQHQTMEDQSHPRPKFSAPPPQPNLALIPTLTYKQPSPLSKSNIPPPPPPPLPLMQKIGAPISSKASQKKPETLPISTTALSIGLEKLRDDYSLERQDSDDMEGKKTKLKPLHWDKVRATSHCETIWDQLKSSSFKLNEDMMENLFSCNSASLAIKKVARNRYFVSAADPELKVLDPKKPQNIAILLRALNVTTDEVVDALLDGSEGLGAELYETLAKMAPTREEEAKLKSYNGDNSKLGSAEWFLQAILDVPFAFKRIEALLYRAHFDTEVNYLKKSYQTLEAASEELKSSQLFLKLLEAVLLAGNRMNVGTNRGDAIAFKLDTLLKLADIRGTDGKTTLLHFVVQEMVRSEGITSAHPSENVNTEDDFRKHGLQVVAGLSRELKNVTKAAGMDSDVLSSYLVKLESGLDNVRLVFQHEKISIKGRFFSSLRPFLKDAEDENIRIKADEKKALSFVKEVTEYFHGDTTKEEAHPFKIFMIVRDFLSVLDHVCKDVGQMKNNTVVAVARIASTASLPVLNQYNKTEEE